MFRSLVRALDDSAYKHRRNALSAAAGRLSLMTFAVGRGRVPSRRASLPLTTVVAVSECGVAYHKVSSQLVTVLDRLTTQVRSTPKEAGCPQAAKFPERELLMR